MKQMQIKKLYTLWCGWRTNTPFLKYNWAESSEALAKAQSGRLPSSPSPTKSQAGILLSLSSIQSQPDMLAITCTLSNHLMTPSPPLRHLDWMSGQQTSNPPTRGQLCHNFVLHVSSSPPESRLRELLGSQSQSLVLLLIINLIWFVYLLIFTCFSICLSWLKYSVRNQNDYWDWNQEKKH